MKYRARRHVTRDDIVVLILLENFDIVENILSAPETLNEPGALIGSVPKNLPLYLRLAPIFLLAAQDGPAGEIGMGGHRVIQRRAARDRKQPEDDERKQDTRTAHAGRQHGYDFVGAGHPAENKGEANNN